MTSSVLKWFANGVIGLVVIGTLCMGVAVQSGPQGAASLMLAEAAAAPADAASAPLVASR